MQSSRESNSKVLTTISLPGPHEHQAKPRAPLTQVTCLPVFSFLQHVPWGPISWAAQMTSPISSFHCKDFTTIIKKKREEKQPKKRNKWGKVIINLYKWAKSRKCDSLFAIIIEKPNGLG